MPIKYIIGWSCPVREALGGEDELINLLVRRHLARSAKKAAREEEVNFGEVSVVHRFFTPDGVTEVAEQLIPLMQELEKREPLADHCADCPACVLDEAFGCFGVVEYPLSSEAVEWLVEVLERPWPERLRRAWRRFNDEERGCRRLAEILREREGECLAGGGDAVAAVPGEDELTLRADDLLAAILDEDGLEPWHALMLLEMLDVLDAEVDDEEFEERPWLEIPSPVDDGPALVALDLYPESSDDKTIIELKTLLAALFHAAALGVTLRVKP